MVDRIATLTTHARTLADITTTQIDLAKINQQVSSGNKAATYSELNGVVERVSTNQGKVARIDNYVQNNTIVSTNLNTMDTSLDAIQKALQTFQSNLTLRNSATTSQQMNFQGLAQNALDAIKGALNVNVGGRFLFSGTESDKPAISDNLELDDDGNLKSSFYNGNSEITSARISDTRTISYGIPGDSDAFKQAFQAILTAKDEDAKSSGADFTKAIDLLNQAVTSIANMRSGVGNNQGSVDAANADHASMKIYWKQALDGDTNTDVAEASIRLAADQTILQATYQVFALTSNLKLSDYLK